MKMTKYYYAMFLICLPFFGHAQKTKKINNPIIGSDTTKKVVDKLLPYQEVISSSATTTRGMITVHKIKDRYLFEISDSLIDKDILIVNRIEKGATGIRPEKGMEGYAGDLLSENIIQFNKGPNNKIFIRNISYLEQSKDSTENGMYRSVSNSNLQPIVAAFDIKAFSPDSTGTVIDVTDYLNGENNLFFFNPDLKKKYGLGGLQADKSYIESIQAFPRNVEIHAVKTYAGATAVTYELNSSIVLLPDQPMRPRYADARVGYFSAAYTDFDADPQGVKNTEMITRWRLEPKPEDRQKYLRGELVEPQKPIIFYIDPATPKKWIPCLIQGVNDWQKAFEKAGFKNAIYALEAPVNDTSWNLEDARHNAIVYKPSVIANAQGPHIHDPRSGEILETHINWFHNVMQLIHDWYMVQAGAIDPKARKMEFDDSLMGQLIRFVSSHEVGHALGLTHNFGASSTIPVDSLRSKSYVEANGICPSIMDYARFNYVAQPEDHISEKGIFPRIGVYDEWAIEWGYRWFPDSVTTEEEKDYLNRWVIKTTNQDKRLWYGSQEQSYDPRCQAEDIGDDAIKAGQYGIKNLKRTLPQLREWTKEKGEDYTSLTRLQKTLMNQFAQYLFHVNNIIGGIYFTAKTTDQPSPCYDFPSKAKQKEAVHFFQKELFTTPMWLLDKGNYSLTGIPLPNDILNLQTIILSDILSNTTLQQLSYAETYKGKEVYPIQELMNDLESGIWSELKEHKSIDLYRRNLQKTYASRLINLLSPPKNLIEVFYYNPNTDIISIVKGQIQNLILKINKRLPFYKDELTIMHLKDVRQRLVLALNPQGDNKY